MAFSFDQIFAADPANPSNIAQNASITIFEPGDVSMTPLAITDPDGQPLSNPIPVNANGFGSAFAHATLDRVAWAGGGFTGFFTSYEGMKEEAVAARNAADTAAANAASAAQADLEARIAAGTFKGEKGDPGADGSNGVNGSNVLPTQEAIEQALINPGPAKTALTAAFVGKGTGVAGPELVTNGTFDTALTGWTGANWAWVSGAAQHTPGSIASLVSATTAPVKGTTYVVTFTISGRTAGSCLLYIGGQWLYAPTGVNGTATGYLTATSTDPLELIPDTAFDGSIDNVSVKVFTGDPARVDQRVTFTQPITTTGTWKVPAGSHIAIGENALVNNRRGPYNIAGSNIAIGYNAGSANVDGQVTAVGYRAAEANRENGVVTAFGKWAGLSSTTGHSTFFGNAAGRSTTTANVDVFGDEAGAENTTGELACFGYYAANKAVNGNATAFGHKAGMNQGPSANYTAMGFEAALAVTGTGLTAMGYHAAVAATTARATAIGHEALASNTASNSVGVGYRTGVSSTGSVTLIGYQAALSATTGRVTAVGSSAALDFTTGNGVFIGHQAGYGLTPANAPRTDAQAVLIGDYANRSVASATYLENYVGVGFNAQVGASNTVAIGNASAANHSQSVALGASSTTTAANQVMVGDRDIESTRTGGGVVLKSPDGTRYKITVANGGTISVAAA